MTVTKTNKKGKATEVSGLGGLETAAHSNPPTPGPGGGWEDPAATVEYYTKLGQTKQERADQVNRAKTYKYLIVGIYRGSLAYAQSPYLVDLRLPQKRRTTSVSRRLNERAWRSVERWVAKWRESGIEELRRRGENPLTESQVAFW